MVVRRSMIGFSGMVVWLAAASCFAELETPLVSPRRIPQQTWPSTNVAANATVITAEDIARMHASTVQEAIARAEGVTFSDQQGFGIGSDSTLNLRGVVNSARTNALVLVDGVRQNRITGDEVHWQSIPVDQIERIEIIRGGGGLSYGEGALAGVTNILTKSGGPRPLQAELASDVGSYGWQRYHTGLQGQVRALGYGIQYTRELLDGYRESSWSRHSTVAVQGSLQPVDGVRTDLHVRHSEDTTGFPGTLTTAQTQDHRRQTNPFHGFNENDTDQVSCDLTAGPWQGMSSTLTLFWRRWIQRSQDSINFNSFTVTPSSGLSLRTNSEWAGQVTKNLLVSGIELSEDKATTGDRDAFEGPDSESNRRGYGLYLEETFTLWDRASLIAGARYDRSRYQESLSFPSFLGTLRFQGWSPKLAMTYTVVPNRLNVFGSYSRPFKAPNIDDLSARVPDFVGNVDLKPQQADTYELGVRAEDGPWSSNATWFSAATDREILLNRITFQNQNFDTRRVGLELATRAQWERVRSYANYTVVDAEFHKGPFAGNTVPGTPRQTMHAGLGVSPIPHAWIDPDWTVDNDFYRINDMLNRLGKADNYGVLNLLLQYELTHPADAHLPSMQGYLKIENITNEEYVTFQSSNGSNLNGAGESPMPPTTFSGGLTIRF